MVTLSTTAFSKSLSASYFVDGDEVFYGSKAGEATVKYYY